jgi:hypothetical protein
MTDIGSKGNEWGSEPLGNVQEEEYCQTYVNNGFNGSNAALISGYSEKNRAKASARLQERSHIARRISWLCGNRLRQYDLTIDDFTRVLKEHLDFNIQDLYDKDGNMIPIHLLPEKVARCLLSMKVGRTTKIRDDGKEVVYYDVVEYKTEGKANFERMLGQYLTLIMESISKTDVGELQKTWANEAEDVYNQFRDEAIKLDEIYKTRYKKDPYSTAETHKKGGNEPA